MSAWRERLAELTDRKLLEQSFCQLTELPKALFVSFGGEQDEPLRKIIEGGAVRPDRLAQAEDEGGKASPVHALSVQSLAQRWAQEDAANTCGPPYFVLRGRRS